MEKDKKTSGVESEYTIPVEKIANAEEEAKKNVGTIFDIFSINNSDSPEEVIDLESSENKIKDEESGMLFTFGDEEIEEQEELYIDDEDFLEDEEIEEPEEELYIDDDEFLEGEINPPETHKKSKFKKTKLVAFILAIGFALSGCVSAVLSMISKQKVLKPNIDKDLISNYMPLPEEFDPTLEETVSTETVEPVTDNGDLFGDLDIEIDVDVPTIKPEEDPYLQQFITGDIDPEKVVEDENGEVWVNEEEQEKSEGSKVTVDEGVIGSDGDVYESEQSTEDIGTTITEDELYYAEDGTPFWTEKDRDAYNKFLKDKEKEENHGHPTENPTEEPTEDIGTTITEPEVFFAEDGTPFLTEDERDKYNKSLKQEPEVFYATDGTPFYTEEDRNLYEKLLGEGAFQNSEEAYVTESNSSIVYGVESATSIDDLNDLKNNLLGTHGPQKVKSL